MNRELESGDSRGSLGVTLSGARMIRDICYLGNGLNYFDDNWINGVLEYLEITRLSIGRSFEKLNLETWILNKDGHL